MAKVPVFLLDENQAVRPDEIGRVSVIEDAAERMGAEVTRINLTGQFRAMGSHAYTFWAERLLGIEPGGPIPWDDDDDFELVYADTPQELEDWLQGRREESVTARITAGYCWPWSDPLPDGSLEVDVQIDAWRRPWNAKPGKKVKGAPESNYWASDPRGFGQVGCIYTAQGFEYDYGGVIIGPDMRWDSDVWTIDPAAHADPVVKRAKGYDALIRNVYKVLLTRGLRGGVIYATDGQARGLLRELIPARASSTP